MDCKSRAVRVKGIIIIPDVLYRPANKLRPEITMSLSTFYGNVCYENLFIMMPYSEKLSF